MHHGLTTNASRELAYQFAKRNHIKTPQTWDKNNIAGCDWQRGFLKRHQQLSIRSPEATSIGRATSFNRENVNKFYGNLETVMEKYKFQPNSIYNIDETGLMTVHKPPKVIASKGEKQVGQITSGERGQLITMCGAINAVGNSIPPLLIFPRVNFRSHKLNGAPPGTIGAANLSGWMDAEIFESWLDHFIKHSHSTKDNPTLLIMDNHVSHVSLAVIDKAKENGVVLLTFPPHTSHKLQPLDRTVYGPLKKYLHTACNDWMLSNPGKLITIYEVAQSLGKSYPRALKPENILAGFRVTGISPYDRNVFGDDEFLSSYVTDREQAAGAEDTDRDKEQHAEQHTPSGEQPPAQQQPSSGEQQPAQQHPSSGEQQPAQQQPSSGEQQPAQQQPSSGEQQPAQQQPSSGSSNLHSNSRLQGSSNLHSNSRLQGSSNLHSNSRIQGSSHLHSNSRLRGSSHLHSNSRLRGSSNLYSNSRLRGSSNLWDFGNLTSNSHPLSNIMNKQFVAQINKMKPDIGRRKI